MVGYIFIIVTFITQTLCTTHWVLSNEGKIVAKEHSVYLLNYPQDLAALTNQERVFQDYDVHENVQSPAFDTEKGIHFQRTHALDTSEIDCTSSINMLHDFNFYESTIIHIEDVESVVSSGSNAWENLDRVKLQPQCSLSSVPFYMGGFDHLEAVLNQDILSMAPELNLLDYLPNKLNLKTFGHIVTLAIIDNPEDWLYYNLASLYWRIQGNAKLSIECIKLALMFAPRNYKHVCLLGLGNILHQSFYSHDALIVLHASLDHNSSEPTIHYMLGNVYALLGIYERSVEYFNNALVLDPYFLSALKRRNTLLCHKDLMQEIKHQQTSLQTTLYQVYSLSAEKRHWMKETEKLVIGASDVRLRANFDLEE